MPTLLIVDDHRQISTILSQYAKKEGYDTLQAFDGREALDCFEKQGAKISLILLDVMMPQVDGFEVCRRIRAQSSVPILMVTARGEDYDKIMGLDIGADDYIVKPFSPGEVMARIRAILRRVQPERNTPPLSVDNLLIDLEHYAVQISGHLIALTKKETEILWMLASHPNQIFSRDHILDRIWGCDYYGDPRTVDSHIKRLRAKLETAAHPAWHIATMWGAGYKFEVKAHETT